MQDFQLFSLLEEHVQDFFAHQPPPDKLVLYSQRTTPVAPIKIEPGVAPFFAYFRLVEKNQYKDYYLGFFTYQHPKKHYQILDWRTSPLAKIYYKYEEGDEYFEDFSDDRSTIERSGILLVKCALRIEQEVVVSVRRANRHWVNKNYFSPYADQQSSAAQLSTADQPQPAQTPFNQSAVSSDQNGQKARQENWQLLSDSPVQSGSNNWPKFFAEKTLPEITSLLSAEQIDSIHETPGRFLLLHGVAGSGKTTVALHRFSWLLQQKNYALRAENSYIFVSSKALARYISTLLFSLVPDAQPVFLLENFYEQLFQLMFLQDPRAPIPEIQRGEVLQWKKSNLLKEYLDRRFADWQQELHAMEKTLLQNTVSNAPAFVRDASLPLVAKIWQYYLLHTTHSQKEGAFFDCWEQAIKPWLAKFGLFEYYNLTPFLIVILLYDQALADFQSLNKILQDFGKHYSLNSHSILEALKAEYLNRQECLENWQNIFSEQQEEKALSTKSSPSKKTKNRKETSSKETPRVNCLDWKIVVEDKVTLLYLYQKYYQPFIDLCSTFISPNKKSITRYSQQSEQMDSFRLQNKKFKPWTLDICVVDEVQDLGLMEIEIFAGLNRKHKNLIFAGDLRQKIFFQSGIENFSDLFVLLGQKSITQRELEVSYRTTREIFAFAFSLLAQQAKSQKAMKGGPNVGIYQFHHQASLFAYLAQALETISYKAPQASVVCLLANEELAKQTAEMLQPFELRNIRFVSDQEFSFQPGVDITTIQDVKGLEFDFVFLLHVNHFYFPPTEYFRLLLHTAATRASWQLNVLYLGQLSQLIPQHYQERVEYY